MENSKLCKIYCEKDSTMENSMENCMEKCMENYKQNGGAKYTEIFRLKPTLEDSGKGY